MSAATNVSAYDLHTRIRSPIIASLLQAKRGETLLDVGSGTGYLAGHLAPADGLTCCLDVSWKNLRSIQDGKTETLYLINSAAEKLPLRAESFHKVLCAEVLEHINADQEALREVARILKPGGVVVITVPCREFGFPSLIELLGMRTVHDYDGPEKHVRKGYTRDELAHSLSEAGMVLCSHVYFCHFFSKLFLDAISIAHLMVRRIFMGQRAWTWADMQSLNTRRSFTLYRMLFPLLLLLCKLDALFLHSPRARGSGIAVAARKPS